MSEKRQNTRLLLVPGTKDDLLHAFLEHVPDGVYFKDRESRFVRISRSLASRFGFDDPAAAVGKTDFDVFTDEHARQAFNDEQQIVRTGEPIVEKEERETWPDGRETWVLTTKLPLVDKQGNITGTMGISRDITERKRLEHELEKYRAQLEHLVTKRTAELVEANKLLEQDVHARRQAEQQLARKAEELAIVNAKLENLSLVDELTGLYNRRGFLATAEPRVQQAYKNQTNFSFAFIDLDGLKHINDKFGHREGDRALVEAADVLRACFRDSDVAARLGGDEFAVLVTEVDEQEIRGRVKEKLAKHNSEVRRQYLLSFSLGFISADYKHPASLESLLQRADALMYQQKRKKRSSRAAGKRS